MGAAELYDVLLLPDWTPRLVIVLLLVGFPVALVLAWAYEVRPEEPKLTKPIIEEPDPSSLVETVPDVRATERRKSIVVLPFDNMSPDPGDAYFADGLTEEIITKLSQITSLRVLSRSSAMVLKGTQIDVRTIGEYEEAYYQCQEGQTEEAGLKEISLR
jgi:hypothetical protein